ncbi:hypothetical protein VSH64_29575 [Amycolatopsis rhabdoformis]|uniref:Uncharacterized protein n=1 Tax=Amycolatopsis rhabdoformis TaxID=1448059 RepID=A0ABZ1I054_9PSEU|nr:hypothetical protein [Amycolatopsis rhabdoformis]WSE27010.1 hypothetical protein VSH64_29575 [Amycolatopsis rhabdoformis]
MTPEDDPPALFAPPRRREPLAAFQRRFKHRPAAQPSWTRVHGKTAAGTVHVVTDEWLPACGTGLNGWDYRGLNPTDDAVTCHRCDALISRTNPPEGQLTLF